MRKCQDLPGQVLFQYLGDDDVPRPVRSSEVNDYLRDVTGLEATAKTFRTWSATLLAAAGAGRACPRRRRCGRGAGVVTGMLAMVSSELNNTPAVCRRSYIHPEVIERYLDGTSSATGTKASARGSRAAVAGGASPAPPPGVVHGATS